MEILKPLVANICLQEEGLSKKEWKAAKSLWNRCLSIPYEIQVSSELTRSMQSMKKN